MLSWNLWLNSYNLVNFALRTFLLMIVLYRFMMWNCSFKLLFVSHPVFLLSVLLTNIVYIVVIIVETARKCFLSLSRCFPRFDNNLVYVLYTLLYNGWNDKKQKENSLTLKIYCDIIMLNMLCWFFIFT